MFQAASGVRVHICVGVQVGASRRRRLTDGLVEAYQLICLEQQSSHLYQPVQLAAVHTHNSFLWIRCQAPASCSQLFDHFLYSYVSWTSAQRIAGLLVLAVCCCRNLFFFFCLFQLTVLNTTTSIPHPPLRRHGLQIMLASKTQTPRSRGFTAHTLF